MQDIHLNVSFFFFIEVSISSSFYCVAHQGWLASEVYILSLYLSLEDWPDFLSLFFSLAALRNWFLVVFYQAGYGRAVSADIAWWIVPAESERALGTKENKGKVLVSQK